MTDPLGKGTLYPNVKTCFSLKHQCGNKFFPSQKTQRGGVPALTSFPGRFPEKMEGVGTALLQYLYLYLTLSMGSHFDWEIAGKNVCVPHSQQDWWKSSKPARCTYNMQPDLLGSFPADVSPGTSGRFEWGHGTKFRPSRGGRGGYRNMGVAKRRIYPFRRWGSFLQKNSCQIFYTSNPNRHPQLYFSKQHFPSLDISLLPNSHPAKIGLKNIYFFRNRFIGCPWCMLWL